jgi:hypothetical protein
LSVFVHIGVPKTGTTTLQRHVFPNHPEIDFRSWPSYEQMPLLHDSLYSESQYISSELLDRCRKEISSFVGASKGPVLFSREHLTHEIFDKGLIAARLSSIFGAFKVIITIREQRSMLESQFLWYLRTMRKPWAAGIPPTSFDTYLAGHWNALRSIKRVSRLATGDYGAIARCYANLVGKENVGIFLFEEMVAAPDVFCEKLFGFIGVDSATARQLLVGRAENKRMSMWEYRYWSALAYLTPLPINRAIQGVMPTFLLDLLRSGAPMRPVMSKEWDRRLCEFYAAGNRYLSEDFQLPLKQYGYAV